MVIDVPGKGRLKPSYVNAFLAQCVQAMPFKDEYVFLAPSARKAKCHGHVIGDGSMAWMEDASAFVAHLRRTQGVDVMAQLSEPALAPIVASVRPSWVVSDASEAAM
jgi:hypothetical protein